jgi:hypothetical protein
MSDKHYHHDDCLADALEHIGDLLERIADAIAPTPEQAALRAEFEEAALTRRSIRRDAAAAAKPAMTNAIGGPQTGRGVR